MVTAAMTAREVAEATIPADEPEKERKVNEAVGRVVTDWDRLAGHNIVQGLGVLSVCRVGQVGPGGMERYGTGTSFRDHAVLTAS
jgi:hypothetical protein